MPAGDLAGFSYRGGGEGFHLHRVSAAGALVSLALTHFSGAGVAQASASERAGFAASNPPADAADQAEQQAAVPADANALESAVVTMYATIFGMAQNRLSIDQAIAFYNAWYPLAIGSRAGALWPALHAQLTAKLLQFVAEARAACAAAALARRGGLDHAPRPPIADVDPAGAERRPGGRRGAVALRALRAGRQRRDREQPDAGQRAHPGQSHGAADRAGLDERLHARPLHR